MKKVLIIAHLMRASPRIPGLAKYLPQFSWQPIIVSAPVEKKPENIIVVETKYRETLGFWKRMFKINPAGDERAQLMERLGSTAQNRIMGFTLARAGEIFNYPDSDRGWREYAIETGIELAARGDISAVISSSSPVTAHIIAREIKSRCAIPWVADLRDLWSQNHNYGYGPFRRRIDERLELKTLADADALVTVSQPWKTELGTLHKREVYRITNGFDPEEINIPPAKITEKFTISYTGFVYIEKQNPTKLFAAIQELISEKTVKPEDIEVRFYGAAANWLPREIEKYGLSGIVIVHDKIPREAVIEKQRESQILLLLDWDNISEKGVYPLKIFEYLAARRPILATGGSEDNVVADLLKETKAGIQALAVKDIKSALKNYYQDYKNNGKVSYHGEESKINRYSYLEMANKFHAILEQVTEKSTKG